MSPTILDNKTTRIDKAADLDKSCRLSGEAADLLTNDLACSALVGKLAESALWPDACKVLAHWLSKRACVWWGCQCLWFGMRPKGDDVQEACLSAAVHWVFDPSEGRRRAAGTVSQSTGTAAQALAFAVFCSGGSMLAPELPVAPPPDHLTGEIVAQAVLLIAAESQRFDATAKQLVALGLGIAEGKNLWDGKGLS